MTTTQPDAPGRERGEAVHGAGISQPLVVLLAVITGATVANTYYAQPLLHTLGRAFGTSNGTAGLIVTIGQIGYVLGLALVVPVGDLLERRTLLTTTMALTAAGMVGCALAPRFEVFAGAVGFLGLTTVTAQIIVPMSASLARPTERGRVVGTVMSGLLLGILLARTFSGIVAAAVGWRVVYWIGAAAMIASAATLRRVLPRVPPTTDLSYGRVLRSVLRLIATEPVLRQRMALGALTFGCFSALWTSLAFLLSGPPFHYGNAVIGLFGLAGVVGAVAATAAGRLSDRGHGGLATTATTVVLLASWAILYLGRHSTAWLIVGIAVLDLGVQGVHIANQSAIYSLSGEARSRLTTAYMVAYFIGGAVVSAVTSSVWDSHGWAGVCVVGAVPAALAVIIWALTFRVGRRRTATGGAPSGGAATGSAD